MNATQIHLGLNHLPLVGAIFALLVLAFGIVRKRAQIRSTGLALLIVAGLASIPTYFSGDEAEDILKNRPGFSKELAHNHEEAAEAAFFGMLFVSLLAAGTLFWKPMRKEHLEPRASLGVAVAAVVVILLMARAAHLGGLISHPELRPDSALQNPANS